MRKGLEWCCFHYTDCYRAGIRVKWKESEDSRMVQIEVEREGGYGERETELAFSQLQISFVLEYIARGQRERGRNERGNARRAGGRGT